MYLKTQGLVLRVTDYNDRDVLLTVLTKEHGRITVRGRGIRRKNSTLAVACQMLVLVEFDLFYYHEHYVINDAHVKEMFTGLRNDIQKLALATYFAQVAELISQEDAPNSQLQPLVLNCLYALSNLQMAEAKVKAVFELRICSMAGFMPDLSGCSICGGNERLLFDIQEGCFVCDGCLTAQTSGIRLPVTQGMVDAMRFICYCDQKRIFQFSLSDSAMESLSQITEAFLVTQLERGFHSLDFYKTFLV